MQKYWYVGATKNTAGVVKLRFTNDVITQKKRHKRNGHTDIVFHQLPRQSTKMEAARILLDSNETKSPEVIDATMRVINRFSHSATN